MAVTKKAATPKEQKENPAEKRFEFFDHTADAKFKAYGKTIEEAFVNAARAMYTIILDQNSLKSAEVKEIHVEGHDEKALLYNFLEELIFLLDADFFAVKDVKKIKISKIDREYVLEAEFHGQALTDDIETEKHVKAITYNEMEITKTKTGVTVQVVLDL